MTWAHPLCATPNSPIQISSSWSPATSHWNTKWISCGTFHTLKLRKCPFPQSSSFQNPGIYLSFTFFCTIRKSFPYALRKNKTRRSLVQPSLYNLPMSQISIHIGGEISSWERQGEKQPLSPTPRTHIHATQTTHWWGNHWPACRAIQPSLIDICYPHHGSLASPFPEM